MVVSMTNMTDGSQTNETIYFGVDGEEFELNLPMAQAEELRRTLEPYIRVARKIGSKPRPRRHGAAAETRLRSETFRDLVGNTPVSDSRQV